MVLRDSPERKTATIKPTGGLSRALMGSPRYKTATILPDVTPDWEFSGSGQESVCVPDPDRERATTRGARAWPTYGLAGAGVRGRHSHAQ